MGWTAYSENDMANGMQHLNMVLKTVSVKRMWIDSILGAKAGCFKVLELIENDC
jgi:hypothetical protein